MKLTDNDHTALVHAFLEFLSQVVRSSPSEPPDKPHGCNKVIELPDAGYTLHLEATFVPRGAMVISPSGTTVEGPVAQYGGPGPAPDPNDRRVEIRDAQGWRSSKPHEVRAGDRIRVSEPDGAFVAEGVATRTAFRNEQGIWTFMVSK